MKIEFLIALLETPGIGKKSARFLADNLHFNIYDLSDLLDYIKGAKENNSRLSIPDSSQLRDSYNKALTIIDQSESKNITPISRYMSNFPKTLFDIPDSPLLIYAHGNNSLLSEDKSVAVIGTREPSSLGIRLGQRITDIFVENYMTIVSGLAIGCDSIAHETCLNNKGKTIAVMAGGLDSIYPKANKGLAERILENEGLLISEYKIGDKPMKNYFVERDRLQSGLSRAVCVIETDVKGGSMHTVGFAEKQEKLIGCINHPENGRSHQKAAGNQMLIKEKRALSLGTPEEVMAFIELIEAHSSSPTVAESLPEPNFIGNLKTGQLTMDF